MYCYSIRPLPYTVLFLLTCLILVSGEVLDVPEIAQEQSEWCWAGVSTCVLRYYGVSITQCEVADYARTKITWHDFGSVSCCDDPKTKCNYWNYNFGYPGSIQEILQANNIENRGIINPLSTTNVVSEIKAGRPFIIRWQRNPSGGHFVVGHGIDNSTLYYMDPWPGEGHKIAEFSWVLSGADHTWQGTNTISTDPKIAASITLVSPRDSAQNQPRTPMLVWNKTTATTVRAQYGISATFTTPEADTIISSDTTLQLPKLLPSTTYYWRLATNSASSTTWSKTWQFTTESGTRVATLPVSPACFSAYGRYENGSIKINYSVPVAAEVVIGIYTLRGELLYPVTRDFHNAGHYTRQIADPKGSSGNHLLSIRSGSRHTTGLIMQQH